MLGATPFANPKPSRSGIENGMVVDIDINKTAYANIARYFYQLFKLILECLVSLQFTANS